MESSSEPGCCERDRVRNKKQNTIDLQQKEDTDAHPVHPVPCSTARQFCKDELSFIFLNFVITTQDLLNFRLVNKIWCEAATACLRQRDTSLICITLDRQVPAFRQGGNNDQDQDQETSNDNVQLFSCRHKYKYTVLTQLSELINIMSNSSRFPSSSLHLHWSGLIAADFNNYPDLLLFFELHGSKIKTLCLHGVVSYKLLSDIIFSNLPKLQCLDLSEAKLKNSDQKDIDYLKTRSSTFGSSPLKSLILSNSFPENHLPLLSSPFKFSSIYNVSLYVLTVLLKHDMANLRLVAGINFNSRHYNFEEALFLMQKEFPWKYPKLSDLTLALQLSISAFVLPGLAQMNKLLSSSKDTLENLKIDLFWEVISLQNRLEIPRLKNLTFCQCYSDAVRTVNDG